ncbi:helix-turn-helix domain-containing protein [Actibacterium sp. MT2.3-13A]|uniref:AraC-like ligand-binding domain-containing protein n=1 Tax=Actibacterium sp. MT2.3-13A TaxID=2828332 RepID=UPI001BAA0618|nr:helix-turn-helix domain-containing protein [Actibacterium sp. MT2.3-13A]
MTPATAEFTTAGLPPGLRAARWSQAIARSYFALELEFRQPERFHGALKTWSLGEVLASRLRSDALCYTRRSDHLRGAGEEEFLLTIPHRSAVQFVQMGRDVTCPPGGFIVERGNEPYEFSYAAANDLIALKVAHRTLADRLPDPGRFCAMEFDGRSGVGALMVDLITASEAHAAEMSAEARAAVGRQVIELLALAIERDPRAAGSRETSVRAAHLSRIKRVIGEDFSNPALVPSAVAAACGISTRYLHELCRSDGASLRQRIREARLSAAHRRLSSPGGTRSITEVAYGCGFSDASSFARAFRARFGVTPRALRDQARATCWEPNSPRK